ncbi:eotaxin-like [Xenopus laevis]|uniref:Eotaxin-like n=1 Tax=Xenopus laevis TaxID=8355 RepID=A0A8J0V9H2_XENLA|nr:eotaxin-like [Xenopus laevis]
MTVQRAMLRVLVLGLTLLSSGLLCLGQSDIDYRRPIRVNIECCTAVSKARIRYPITSYKKQSAANLCVHAIILRTTNHGSFCVDPKAKWVRKKVKRLNNGESKAPQKTKKKGRNNQKRKQKQPRPTVKPSRFPLTSTAPALT